MKIKTLIITLLVLIAGNMPSFATQLPMEIKTFLQSQKNIPSVRYDSVILYNKDIMYIPVIPAHPVKTDKLKIVKTIPANQSMDKLPDIVVFDNNYSLIKVFKTGQDTVSANNIADLPEVIKTGMIPQDIMVPKGLILPECYAPILGDVQIPLIGSAKSPTFISGRRPAPLPTGQRRVDIKPANVPLTLRNKLFIVNNFQTEFLEVFSSTVSEPLYSLKTSGIIKDIKPVLNGKYLLAASSNLKNIDVIDVEKEFVAKHIDLMAKPTEIVVDEDRNKAYVASTSAEALFVIDLQTMTMKEKIQLAGAPQRLAVSADGTKIAYFDIKSSNIYILDMENDYENKLITNYPNTTKIILGNNVMYLISRTEPKLRVVQYDLLLDNKTAKTKKDKKREAVRKEENKKTQADHVTDDIYSVWNTDEVIREEEDSLLDEAETYSTSIDDIEVGAKPIDMYSYKENIYVLSAGENSVYTYNTATGAITSEKLPVDGFSKAFTRVPDSNLAVITNMSDLKYVVYDLDKSKPLQTLPISEYINSITILERKNGQ